MSAGNEEFDKFAKDRGLYPGYEDWRLARDAWLEAREKALEEVETIAELYHNPVAQAIVKEIRRLREKKA